MDELEDPHFKLPNSLFSSYSTAFSKMKQPSYLKLNTISQDMLLEQNKKKIDKKYSK